MYSIIARVAQCCQRNPFVFYECYKCITLTLVIPYINYRDTQKSVVCMHIPWLGVATPQQSTPKFYRYIRIGILGIPGIVHTDCYWYSYGKVSRDTLLCEYTPSYCMNMVDPGNARVSMEFQDTKPYQYA